MSSKMNGLISYDILDHPDYISAKKIETRIVRYYEAVKAHQAAGPQPWKFVDKVLFTSHLS